MHDVHHDDVPPGHGSGGSSGDELALASPTGARQELPGARHGSTQTGWLRGAQPPRPVEQDRRTVYWTVIVPFMFIAACGVQT
jgi:hypothetical protein